MINQDIIAQIKKAAFGTLNNNLFVNGKKVTVSVGFAPAITEGCYVLIETVRDLSNGTKTSYESLLTVEIVVYSKYLTNSGIECDTLASEVISLMNKEIRTGDFIFHKFRNTREILQAYKDTNNQNATQYQVIERRIILEYNAQHINKQP